MDIKSLIQEYLGNPNNKAAQLATVRDGKPWICTIYFVSDENFNLYWTSARERQHSADISLDSKTAMTVVQDTERKQALQIVGNAYEVSNDDIERVHELYQSKYGRKDYDLEEMKQHNSTGRTYWVFRPGKISLWDEVNFPDNPKQEFLVNS